MDPDDRAAHNATHEHPGDTYHSRLTECSNCGAIRTAGAPCGHCGFMPETRPRYVVTADGELGLVDHDRRVAAHAQKIDFFGQLATIAQERGYKPGYAAVKFKERFGTWPPWPRGAPPPLREPTPEVRGWVKSREIAWAKSQARGAP